MYCWQIFMNRFTPKYFPPDFYLVCFEAFVIIRLSPSICCAKKPLMLPITQNVRILAYHYKVDMLDKGHYSASNIVWVMPLLTSLITLDRWLLPSLAVLFYAFQQSLDLFHQAIILWQKLWWLHLIVLLNKFLI